jgi:muramoyltetrapeptide carboxypeptidase
MLKPRALQPGGRIAIVAPASPFRADEFETGLGELRRLGFDPVYEPSVFDRQGYVAGTAHTRAAALRRALADESIGAIMAVRGGYGSVHVLPLLDPDDVRRARKPIVGYSDLTSLLSYVCFSCGTVAFHGPTVAGRVERGRAGYDEKSFLAALTRVEPLGELAPPQLEVVNPGEAAGPLFGGNLTQIAASLGTPFAFDPPAGCILFLEDVNERPYRLDRLWTQLRLAGIIGRASAIVLGEFPGCDEPVPGRGPSASGEGLRGRDTLASLAREFPGPVLYGFPSGHTAGAALTLPLGVRARVMAGDRPALVIEEPAVSRD